MFILGRSLADTEMWFENIKRRCSLLFQRHRTDWKMAVLFSLSYKVLLSMNTWTSGLLTRYKSGMEPSFDIVSAWCFVQWRRKVCGQCWLLLRIYVHRMYLRRDVARALCGTTISGWTWITWKLRQQLRGVLHISQLSFTLKYGLTSKSKLKTTWLSFMIRRELTRYSKRMAVSSFNSIETHWCHGSLKCGYHQTIFLTFAQDAWQLQRLLLPSLAYLQSLHSALSL